MELLRVESSRVRRGGVWWWRHGMDEGSQGGSSRTAHLHHTTLIDHSVVCTTLRQLVHVWGFTWAPRYFLWTNILSRKPHMIYGQGIPSVREFWQLHILLRLLSPEGVDWWSLAHVWQSRDRSIRERHGRHCGSSKLAVGRDNKQVGKWLEKYRMVPLIWELVSSLGNEDGDSSLPTTPHPLPSMVRILKLSTPSLCSEPFCVLWVLHLMLVREGWVDICGRGETSVLFLDSLMVHILKWDSREISVWMNE